MSTELRFAARHFRWFPADHPLGRTEETVALDAGETAFVVVDVYMPEKDEQNPVLSSPEYQAKYAIAVEHIAPALEAARRASLPVVYVTNSAPNIAMEQSEFAQQLQRAQGFAVQEDFTERNVDPLEYHYGDGRWLCFTPALAPKPGDLYIRKHVYSGFYATRLDDALRNLGIRNLIFVGFRIDACLGTTMLDALYRNYRVFLLRDCTLACELPDELPGRQFTQRMLIWFEAMIGRSVDSRDFIEACARS